MIYIVKVSVIMWEEHDIDEHICCITTNFDVALSRYINEQQPAQCYCTNPYKVELLQGEGDISDFRVGSVHYY